MTQSSFIQIPLELINYVRSLHLSGTQYDLWLYLYSRDPYGDQFVDLPSPTQIAEELGVNPRTIQRGLIKLQELSLLPYWAAVSVREPNPVEKPIRDRLQNKLGGLTEVSTPAGRIDLLTITEIIEIKQVNRWKEALGQILIYSAFYPNHQKRIHLFGENLHKLPDIESACLPFDVIVTGEEVNNG